MLCIRCSHDSRYPERPGRVCPRCRGKFAFEPREGDPVTDQLIKKAIEAVSALGTVRWGVENLYYEVCRRKRSKVPPVWFGCVLLLLGCILIGVAIARPQAGPLWIAAAFLGICGVGTIIKRPSAAYVVLTPNEFGK